MKKREKKPMHTVKESFDFMAKVFNKEEAKKFKRTVLTYNVGGQGGGTWQLVLENGEFKITEGNKITPVTATMNYKDADALYKLTTGEMGGLRGYTTGAIKFSGPRAILESLPKVFPGSKS
jgi:putative sterol carrier protein